MTIPLDEPSPGSEHTASEQCKPARDVNSGGVMLSFADLE